MKALVLDAPNMPFELLDVPDPVPGPGEAVARVWTCGAGLTIQHVKAGRIPAKFPRIIGHEIAGEIVDVGVGARGLSIGDFVTAYYYLNCGYCYRCLAHLEPLCENAQGNVGIDCDGGYAEYIKLPAHLFIQLPEELRSVERAPDACVVTDAIATPYKVLKRAAVTSGETVAIFGAGGGLGIHQTLLARWRGAHVIAVDTAQEKEGTCRKAGADAFVNAASMVVPDAIMELTSGKGVDVAIDYVSSRATLTSALQSLAVRGRLVTLGGAGQEFSVGSRELMLKEQSVFGSRYVTRSEILESLRLVADGAISPMVTDVVPMEQAEELHERLESGTVIGRAALRICPR